MSLFNRVVTILSIALFLFCCKNKDARRQNKPNDAGPGGPRMHPYVEDSLVAGSRQQLFLQNLGKCMGLPRMPHGLSKLNIRIWLWGLEKSYVVDLSDSGSLKRSYIAEFTGETADGRPQIAIHREWKELLPTSDGDSIFNNVVRYGITKLEGGKLAEQLRPGITHGAYVQFEVARPSGYKFFEYYTPDYYRGVDPDSRKVYDFLKYLNRELGVIVYDGVDDGNIDFKATEY